MVKRKNFLYILMIMFVVTSLSFGQNVLKLKPYDGTPESLFMAQIRADTLANHGIPANRVYELQADGIYLNTEQMNIAAGLTIRVKGAAGKRAIIYQFPTGTGSNPQRPPGNLFVLLGGNVELSHLCVVGYFEPDQTYFDNVQGGLINTTAAGSSIIVDDCILSEINGQHLRTGSATKVVKVTNSIFANMGALSTSNFGAGKGIDLRDASCDSLILLNNTFVNYQDRIVRHYNFSNPLAGTGGIGYTRIDHNTFLNGMGFHGLLSLGNVGNQVHITNNLFVDAFASGEDSTDATRSAEWANTGEKYPSGKNRIMWIFTAPNDTTKWWVRNNVYTISSAGQAFFDNHKTEPIVEGSPLSWHINKRLGKDSLTAFKKMPVTLSNTPALMTNLMEWYLKPSGGNKTKNTPSSLWVRATDDMDRREVSYFRDEFNAAYATSNTAYTYAEKGFPVGDLNWFPSKKSDWIAIGGTDVETTTAIPTEYVLEQNYPNPFNPSTTIAYSLPQVSSVSLTVFNMLGQEVATLVNGLNQNAGSYKVNWDGKDSSGKVVATGIYFYQLKTNQATVTKKMMLIK